MLWLFILTVFTSASLVFSIQPIYARLLLPLLGGSPAVWNTVVTFFQGVLLLGYSYAHLLTKRAPLRWQLIIHAVVLSLPMFLLPVAMPAGLEVPQSAQPHLWIYWLMMVTVGAPFFALSTTTPLMQKWFSWSGHRQSENPYFLYVASNTGSLLALLSYPIVIEPVFGLGQQASCWRYGYLLLVLLVVACALYLWRNASQIKAIYSTESCSEAGTARQTINWPTKLRWLLLAFIPSSLMLGVTTFVSSEVAAIPLMWIVPLALYLLTYIFAFARRQFIEVEKLRRIQILMTVGVAMLVNMQATQPLVPLMVVHLLYFFVTAWLCHTLLAAIKPPAEYLTEYYLWLCIGGVLGGVFNSLVAPLVFSSVLEYPIVIVAAGFAIWWETRADKQQIINWLDWSLPLALFGLLLMVGVWFSALPEDQAVVYGVIFGLPALGCFFFSKRPLRFALGIAALLFGGLSFEIQPGRELYAERSFYGINRVTLDPRGFHLLFHGRTLHGMQSLDESRKSEPLTYYHPSGPIGDVFSAYGQQPDVSVALVGLGTGALATYARPGQEWSFYEIDPVVETIARDPRYFTYLRDASVPVAVVLGDARLNLIKARDAKFGIIVLDAYSSDSIPIHLVTREAMLIYLRKLAPGGVIAAHISNQHLDLEPVFAALADDLDLQVYFCDDTSVDHDQMVRGKSASQWLVLGRRNEGIEKMAKFQHWSPTNRDKKGINRVWTDDYSSIWNVFYWR